MTPVEEWLTEVYLAFDHEAMKATCTETDEGEGHNHNHGDGDHDHDRGH